MVCKTKGCNLLSELFSNFTDSRKATNRDYYVMTEIFCLLHKGKDYCEE